MYTIPELNNLRPPQCSVVNESRIFFSIYYRVDDNAFRRAAQTWRRVVTRQESFNAGKDVFFEIEVVSEADFVTAWNNIAAAADRNNAVVWIGQLFTHASKGSQNDGLEFKRSAMHDGTLSKSEILNLPKLPWHAERGVLILSGCNTGTGGKRGWTPAAQFASSQQVITLGQNGYGYFFKNWSTYSETSKSDSNISLWAYKRGQNGALGNGSRVPATICTP